jgi:multidrug efflux pump subunit AcrA (membrane-fusion protein)
MKARILTLHALALAGALVVPVRAENARAVRVQPVALTQQRESVTYSGTVGARIMVDLAFRIAGKVVAHTVNISDHVTRNQIIVRLDPTDQRLQAARAESAVTAAEADAANARAMFLRYEKMVQANCVGYRSNLFLRGTPDHVAAFMRISGESEAGEALLHQTVARDPGTARPSSRTG